MKTNSSGWLHNELQLREFQWQTGYGAFAVSYSNIDSVTNYIMNQEEHHRKKTFQEEYVELLKLSGVEYDPKYLW